MGALVRKETTCRRVQVQCADAYATPSAKAANLKATVTAFAAAVVCTTKMVNDGERVEFYPTYRDIDFPSIRTRLPAVGLNPVIRYNVYLFDCNRASV